jgi:glycosyltransferase involved in cell wall biosynthesis
MRCGVPIISGNLTSLPEVAGNAALYVDPFNTEEITSAFFRLENEPETYSKLIENGIARATEFDWNKTAAIVWEVILKTYSK